MRIRIIRMRADGILVLENWHELNKIFKAEIEWVYLSGKFRIRIHENLLK